MTESAAATRVELRYRCGTSVIRWGEISKMRRASWGRGRREAASQNGSRYPRSLRTRQVAHAGWRLVITTMGGKDGVLEREMAVTKK